MTKTGVSYYPELYDKLHNAVKPGDKGNPEIILTKCTTSFIKGSCDTGHQFAKALVCGKEWCEECGRFDSVIHKRRIARWWAKALQMPKMGYLVITVPDTLRDNFKDKKVLSEFRTYCKRKLQRMGYPRGLIRYHWAGDCGYCKGQGCKVCNGTGADRQYKPHLNILIDEGYLSKEDFEKKFVTFRNDLKKWFDKKFKLEGDNKVEGNLWYSYAISNSHKVHKLKYITRATFRHYNKEVCDVIRGYRTTSTWGKWPKCDVARVSPLVSLEQGLCPCCGGGIKWRKEFYNKKVFHRLKSVHIAGGYYLIEDTS